MMTNAITNNDFEKAVKKDFTVRHMKENGIDEEFAEEAVMNLSRRHGCIEIFTTT